MQTIAKSLPDLASYFERMKLCDAILNELIGNQNFIAGCIKNALYDRNANHSRILREIKEMICDNYSDMVGILGQNLVNQISIIKL